jgi:hypothetical protein
MLAGTIHKERVADEDGSINMRKSLVAIENWAVVESVISPSYEELQPGRHLMGNVLGHASLQNTKLIYTSRILNVYQGVVETLNTLYQLGEPSEEYKEWERRREANALSAAGLRSKTKEFPRANDDSRKSQVA